jgi:hypothetical protein
MLSEILRERKLQSQNNAKFNLTIIISAILLILVVLTIVNFCVTPITHLLAPGIEVKI